MANFVAQIWQIHPFAEGSTRTVAVFLMKLLGSYGFKDVTNELFKKAARCICCFEDGDWREQIRETYLAA